MKAEELIKGKLGLRIEEEDDGVRIYANAWTLIVDICRWIIKNNKK